MITVIIVIFLWVVYHQTIHKYRHVYGVFMLGVFNRNYSKEDIDTSSRYQTTINQLSVKLDAATFLVLDSSARFHRRR